MHPAMPRMRRWRAIWLAIALISGIAWAASGTHYLMYSPGNDWGYLSFAGGGFNMILIDHSINPTPRSLRSPLGYGVWRLSRSPDANYGSWLGFRHLLPGLILIFVPLWIPTLLFLIIAARPWGIVGFTRARRASRRRALGMCESCGYDMNSAIDAARCPECGGGLLPPCREMGGSVADG